MWFPSSFTILQPVNDWQASWMFHLKAECIQLQSRGIQCPCVYMPVLVCACLYMSVLVCVCCSEEELCKGVYQCFPLSSRLPEQVFVLISELLPLPCAMGWALP